MEIRRLLLLVIGIALVAAACGSTDSTDAVPTTAAGSSESPSSAPQPAVGVLPEGPSALDEMTAPEFPEPLVDPREIISGGPPPDGIPPIDAPVFVEVAENLDLLDPAEAVVALEIDGDARAYPAQVLIWHEIVNDTVGGEPVSITYCPLCNSAVTYRREIRGVETTFGTSGRLFASALVMYDRATESLWTHFDGHAVVGVLTGETLESIPSPLMSWEEFRSTYPTGRVLDPSQTGFTRRYGSNPYVGYDDESTEPFLFRGALDDRAAAKRRVVGIVTGGEAVAFALDALQRGSSSATSVSVGGEPLVIFWKAGQSSAIDSALIGDGRDVGSVAVFRAEVGGRTLTFQGRDTGFADDQTGTTWNLVGEAIDGELRGTRLEQLHHLDTFWFAWSTYQPDTTLVEQVEE